MGVPPEILSFLQDENGKTLLIKGEPGTGKTILALTILKEICSEGNGVYLSTRVDPETLYILFPWIRESIPAEHIVDATMTGRPTKKEMVLKPLKYADVPDFLKEVYGRTEELKKPIIVIDSWDAVVGYTGHYKAEDREKLEHNVCDFSRRTKTKVIFIAEYTEQKPMDYLVDGVVVTRKRMMEERKVREMVIDKLRGVSTKKSVYLYTLESGKFNYFEDFKTPKSNPLIPEIIPNPDGEISTGFNDLDRIIGGFKKGGLNLLLFSREVLSDYHWLIYPCLINHLNQGGMVCTVKGSLNLKEGLSPYLKEEVRGNIKDREECGVGNSLWLMNLDKGTKEEIEEIIESNRKNIFIGVAREAKAGLENTVSSCIKIIKICGTLCLYGNQPRTGIYAVDLAEYPRIKLVQIL